MGHKVCVRGQCVGSSHRNSRKALKKIETQLAIDLAKTVEQLDELYYKVKSRDGFVKPSSVDCIVKYYQCKMKEVIIIIIMSNNFTV